MILICVTAFHILTTIYCLSQNSGIAISFLLFSVTFLLLLVHSASNRFSPSYTFFGIMLWLGFYAKYVVHAILKYPYSEPVGSFSNSFAEWNEVFKIASVGAAGVFLGVLIGNFVLRSTFRSAKIKEDTRGIQFYVGNKNLIIFVTFFMIIFVTTCNLWFGINLSGMVVITRLPWPLNAATGWLLYVGFAILISQILYWESKANKSPVSAYSLALFEALTSSVSILSRGLYLFHIIPTIVAYSRQPFRKLWNSKNTSLMFILTLIFFFCNSFGVTTIRNALFVDNSFMFDFYDADDNDALLFELSELHAENESRVSTIPEVKKAESRIIKAKTPKLKPELSTIQNAVIAAKSQEDKLSKMLLQISKLAIDRWVGVEGIMAVSSYQRKNFELFIQSFFHKPVIGELDIFESISKSIYQPSLRYSFASIPGPIAFFFYSGSASFVLLCMFLIGLTLATVDFLTERIFQNPFLKSQIAFYVAIAFAQAGLSPRPLGISFLMTFFGLCGFRFLLFAVDSNLWQGSNNKEPDR